VQQWGSTLIKMMPQGNNCYSGVVWFFAICNLGPERVYKERGMRVSIILADRAERCGSKRDFITSILPSPNDHVFSRSRNQLQSIAKEFAQMRFVSNISRSKPTAKTAERERLLPQQARNTRFLEVYHDLAQKGVKPKDWACVTSRKKDNERLNELIG
jgi:hypothetical protein